jgi:hypothetical protein
MPWMEGLCGGGKVCGRGCTDGKKYLARARRLPCMCRHRWEGVVRARRDHGCTDGKKYLARTRRLPWKGVVEGQSVMRGGGGVICGEPPVRGGITVAHMGRNI